jgi:hypothetical protein
VAHPVSEIIPPLHEWMRLPLSWSGISDRRAFSVVAALLLDRF